VRLIVATKQGVHVVRWIEGERSGRIVTSALESSNLTCSTSIRGTAFVGTRGGELFSSSDRGASWQRLESLRIDGAVTALTGLPLGGGLLLAGTEPAALHVSRDGGASWAEASAFNRVQGQERWRGFGSRSPLVGTIVCDAREPQHLYVGIKIGGAYRSDDGGTSWRNIGKGLYDEVHRLAVDPRDTSTIYAGTGGGFYRSPDRGVTWYAADGEPGRRYITGLVTVAPSGRRGSRIFLLTAAGPPGTWHKGKGADVKVYRSEDEGVTLEELSVVATRNAFTAAITNPDNHDAAVVATSHGSIYHVDRRDREWHHVLYGLPPIRSIVPV
jgi:photosystem II stability/assembly factor-like uncharacterized protein